jgi:hypothetical protein
MILAMSGIESCQVGFEAGPEVGLKVFLGGLAVSLRRSDEFCLL